MKNRMLMLLTFVAAFILVQPVAASAPEGDTTAAVETKAEPTPEPAPAKAEPAPAKADAKTEAAPKEIETDADATLTIKQLISAAKDGKWGLVAALLITMIV